MHPPSEALTGDLREEQFAARVRDVLGGPADPIYGYGARLERLVADAEAGKAVVVARRAKLATTSPDAQCARVFEALVGQITLATASDERLTASELARWE